MISPKQLLTYCQNAMQDIPEIKTVKVVVDESQLVDRIRTLKETDNQILVAVLPEYDTANSDSIDNLRDNNYLAFLILEKVNYKAITEDKELDVWENTLPTIVQLRERIIRHSAQGCADCPDFSNIDAASIRIEPVWKMAECNGYIMALNIDK